MIYLTKSVEAIGQVIGAVMGIGFSAPIDNVLKTNTFLGYF